MKIMPPDFIEIRLDGLKVERKRPLDAIEYATLEWVDWFNNRRLFESIGNVPPAELEQAYYDQLEDQAEAA